MSIFVAMLLKDITSFLESKAPLALQESYDNCGLITGNLEMEVSAAIISLDCTEAVVKEAIFKGANLIIAHHPIVFSGLKKITGKNYIERTIILAIKHDIAIYAIHTNLDNIAAGVNKKIADRIGLVNTHVLDPKSSNLNKLIVFVPISHMEMVRSAAFEAGAGHIGSYDQCSFFSEGQGSFRGGDGTNPFAGEPGVSHVESEVRLEVVVPSFLIRKVLSAVIKSHPYEEVAYDVIALQNEWSEVGAGLIGQLPEPISTMQFLKSLKVMLKTNCIRHTALVRDQVKTIAVCGGSGSFLLQRAMNSGADMLVTADFKYHQFFDAESQIVIADVGHYESEQFTMELLNDWLKQKFPTFASHLTEVVTNPVQYL